MRRLWITAMTAALGLGIAACSDAPSEKDCAKLLDHLIDLELAESGTGELTPEMEADIGKQKEQLAEYLEKGFMDKCTSETPKGFVKCGLKAKDKNELAACEK